jgi:hypothetical protein
VIPFRRLRTLLVIITSFTVAHSITLFASAFGFAPDALWFPPLIETLIAITIVYMALENIVYEAMGSDTKGVVSRRWVMAFVFGLVHGFGFSFVLRETLQFAGDHLLASLLAFNVGVEIGQPRGPARAHTGARTAVSLRHPGENRNYHHIGARRAHGLALDA